MLNLRFKNGKVLIRDGKLAPNCCRWRVLNYTVQILGVNPSGGIKICNNFGEPNCPACESTPVFQISNMYFNGTPRVVVEAAVSGFIDVNCKFTSSHQPMDEDNPVFFPCVSTTIPWKDRIYTVDVCITNKTATVTYEFEDCPSARNFGDGSALLSRDLRVIFSLEAQ